MTEAIDVHVHCSEYKDDLLRRYAAQNGLSYDLEELLSSMDDNSISHSLLLSPVLESGRPVPNAHILELCKRGGSRLSPVLTVDSSGGSVTEVLGMAARERGVVKGFKILLGYSKMSATDPVLSHLYDFAEANGLPVMFHTGDTALQSGSLRLSHPLVIDEVASRRPHLKIVLCHMGNPWIETAAELLYKHPRVYADLSGLITGGGKYREKYMELLRKRLNEAVYFVGDASKFLFGSDYPVESQADALRMLSTLDVDSTDLERILRHNARELFGL